MKVNTKVLGSTAALAILVLAFQNCSPVNFGTNEQQAAKGGKFATPVDDEVLADNNTDPDYDYADNSENDPEVPPRSGDEYRAKCAEEGDNSFLKLAPRAHVSGNSSGALRLKASSIHSVSGNHEELVILRDGGSGIFKSLSGNVSKVVVICGFKMSSISGNAKKIVLVNSHVEHLSGNHPNVEVVDTTFGKISGNIGQVLE